MAADDERPPEPRQLAHRRAHLLDNLIDADIGTQVVAWKGDTDAMRIQPGGKMTGRRVVERLPVTAVNEDDNRPFPIAGKIINPVPRARPVGNSVRGMTLAISRSVSCPTRENRRVLRNPGPVV